MFLFFFAFCPFGFYVLCLFVCVSVCLLIILAQGPAAPGTAGFTINATIDMILTCVVVGNDVSISFHLAEREEARRLLGAGAAESTPAQDAPTLLVRTRHGLGASGSLTWVLELCHLFLLSLMAHHLRGHVIALLAVADHLCSEAWPHPVRVEKLRPAEGPSLNLWLYQVELPVGMADDTVLSEARRRLRRKRLAVGILAPCEDNAPGGLEDTDLLLHRLLRVPIEVVACLRVQQLIRAGDIQASAKEMPEVEHGTLVGLEDLAQRCGGVVIQGTVLEEEGHLREVQLV